MRILVSKILNAWRILSLLRLNSKWHLGPGMGVRRVSKKKTGRSRRYVKRSPQSPRKRELYKNAQGKLEFPSANATSFKFDEAGHPIPPFLQC